MACLEKIIDAEHCIDRHVYRIFARNLRVGVFVSDTGGFIGVRQKGHPKNLYLSTEYHRDNGPPFGTACPLEDLGPLPNEVRTEERLGTVCYNCGVAAKYDTSKPRKDSEGISYPGTWIHLGPTACSDLRPVALMNETLFQYLKSLEEKLGFTWPSVEEYEKATQEYLKEIETDPSSQGEDE